ncbi:MAG: Nramp family divalent metal transporter [Deltaproteobacteria bacterium]|nr:Nramp family divalent metal transporter [Deltaproteobacteria bacterium]
MPDDNPKPFSIFSDGRFGFNIELLRYLGPGFLVTVGFIDPGNWAANIAAGSEFNYSLLWVVTLGTAMLVVLQHISAHLGIVTGECLAESCRRWFPGWANLIFGGSIMAACTATALAEFLGAGIGISIITGMPLSASVVIAGTAVLMLVGVQRYDSIEHVVIAFVSIIGFCYLIEMFLVKPDWGMAAAAAFTPSLDGRMVFIAMGMLGAVVMPHNLYLHSEVIQRRNWSAATHERKKTLLRYEFLDTLLAMGAGWVINAAMVVVAAAVFYGNGVVVTDIVQASATLRPLAGPLATGLFAVALLCAGISSSITACLAGGTVFTGFLGKEIDHRGGWFRTGVLVAAVPAIVMAAFVTDTYKALIWSQVLLSLQLPLSVLPLILLTRSRKVMGRYANGRVEGLLLYLCAVVSVVLNGLLVLSFVGVGF